MKKVLALILAAVLCFGLFACGKDDPAKAPDTTEKPAADEAAEPEVQAEPEAEAAPAEEPAPEEPAAEEAPAEEPAPAEEAPAETAASGFENVALPADGVIHTAEELGKVLTEGDAAGIYKVDAAELDMSGIKYSPLGTADKPFTGSFDFGGCTLKGLSVPLILYASGASIGNLKISDTKIECDEAPEDLDRWGLVVCSADSCSFDDIDVADSAELNVSIFYDDACVGGIIGYASGTSKLSNLSCAAKMNTESLKIFIGAVIGKLEGSAIDSCIMEDCVSNAAIVDTAEGHDSKVGGVAGGIYDATAINCANYGTVTSDDGGQCAGVIAYVGGGGYLIENCLNAGVVDGGTYTGGIVGYSNRANGVMNYCINTASVSGNSTTTGAIGGLVKNTEVWTSCYWTADSCADGYTFEASPTFNDLAAVADADTAVKNANAAGGSFGIEDGRVVIK